MWSIGRRSMEKREFNREQVGLEVCVRRRMARFNFMFIVKAPMPRAKLLIAGILLLRFKLVQ